MGRHVLGAPRIGSGQPGVRTGRPAQWPPGGGGHAAWSPLGSGFGGDGTVHALAVLPGGDLVAGGFFTSAGGAGANFIARWNGADWSPLGSGMDSAVRALAVAPDGDLFAGGSFSTAGDAPAHFVARWSGSTWSALGNGVDNTVHALAVLPNGDLFAGGEFETAGAVDALSIARWNGAAWFALGSGVDANVTSLTALPNGDLVAGGAFSTAFNGFQVTSANHVVSWDGASWPSLGSGTNGTVQSLAFLPNGDLFAGGPDINGDGVVDGADLGILLSEWGACPECGADLNGDGVVDGGDLGLLLASWT